MATTISRWRDGFRSMVWSRPERLIIATIAATWPCIRTLVISSLFRGSAIAIAAGTTSPFSALRTASTVSSANEDRLATVRFMVLPFSRHDSRRSTAGGEFRLGTRSMYMGSDCTVLNDIRNPCLSVYMGAR